MSEGPALMKRLISLGSALLFMGAIVASPAAATAGGSAVVR
jgi:hypothetical protein